MIIFMLLSGYFNKYSLLSLQTSEEKFGAIQVMEKEEKIKIAITAGIAAVILLILVLFVAFGSPRNSADNARMEENILGYAEGDHEASDSQDVSSNTESSKTKEDAGSELTTDDTQNESANALYTTDASKDAVKDHDKEASASKETTKSSEAASSSGNTASSDKSAVPSKASRLVDSFFEIKRASLKDVYKSMKVIPADQLKEMYTYWDDDNMAAVRDLAHLERFEAMSFALSGGTDFYYYGETDSSGNPDGKGIAVYADDQYYFGDWKDGKRNGKGTWICFYPKYSETEVSEHLYTGEWKDDLPYGQGQEHTDYKFDKLNSEDIYIQNAIGGFKGGLYDGEMYIITVDSDEDTTEWVGKCEKGSFEQIPYAAIDENGLLPFLNEREDDENHIYLSKKGNTNIGVKGITTGGKIKK